MTGASESANVIIFFAAMQKATFTDQALAIEHLVLDPAMHGMSSPAWRAPAYH
jgi:hypothetical protein